MEKSPWNKKSLEIRLNFLGFFFLIPVWFYTKNTPKKSPLIVKNAWDIKNTPGCINMQILKKALSSDILDFAKHFFQNFFSCDFLTYILSYHSTLKVAWFEQVQFMLTQHVLCNKCCLAGSQCNIFATRCSIPLIQTMNSVRSNNRVLSLKY